MANLAITNTFSSGTTIASGEVNTNNSDVQTYINNRNGGSVGWDNLLAVAGTSSSNLTASGRLTSDFTAVGNVGTGEDNLITYAMPANVLSGTGKGVRVLAFGTTAANGNAKTIKVYFGSTLLKSEDVNTGSNAQWFFTFVAFRSASNTQKYMATVFYDGQTISGVSVGTATETDSGAITIKCTGEAVSNNDIVQTGLIVEAFN